MTWEKYYEQFDTLLKKRSGVYAEDDIHHYTEMNIKRTERVLKTVTIPEEVKAIIQSVRTRQQWELITEHWCGDAAHACPLIYKLSELNPNISLKIQLRDTDSEIESYLTDGARSIPKLIVRDEQGEDLFTWGPRPALLQQLYLDLKEKGFAVEDIKVEIQKWYNKDKGVQITQEITQLLKKASVLTGTIV